MKNTALILFLFLTLTASAQVKYDTIGTDFVYYENIEKLRPKVDGSLESCKRNFAFLNSEDSQSTLQLIYQSKDSIRIVFSFDKLVSGEDQALEIKGKGYYKLYTIKGRFLDLFPIWKTKFDDSSTQDAVIKAKNSTPVYVRIKDKDYLCRLYGAGENWTISVSEQIKPHYSIK